MSVMSTQSYRFARSRSAYQRDLARILHFLAALPQSMTSITASASTKPGNSTCIDSETSAEDEIDTSASVRRRRRRHELLCSPCVVDQV
jgi:hypothetical protein